MGIALTDEHVALAASVRGLAGRSVDTSVVRAALDADTEVRPPFWDQLAEQGLLALHVAEQYGGAGYGLAELVVAVEELGRAAAPGPFVPTVLAAAAVQAADAPKAQADLLPGLADGSRTGAVSLAAGLTARRDGDGLVVSGTARPVLGAALADLVVTPVAADGGTVWVALDAAALTVTPLASLDLVRRSAEISADGVAVPAERVLTGLDRAAVLDLAAVLFGAEAVGVAGWCVDTSAEYARTRVQFGRPIGQFQAVKHKAARMLTAVEQARAAVWDAARALDARAADAPFAAGVAAVVAPDAAVQAARDCIQIHGGIGFTWEAGTGIYLRRALTIRQLLGGSTGWATAVARLALRDGTRATGVELDESTEPVRERVRAEVARLAAVPDADRWARMGDDGWTVPHLPRPWGRDAGPVEQVVIAQELRAAGIRGPNLGLAEWMVPSLVAYGTPEQQERFLPPTLRGRLPWCQLFSEPGAGSDLASLTTRATRVEGGWLLNGQKVWTTFAHVAKWGYCLARTDPDAPKQRGITYFLVDMSTKGVDVRPLRELTGAAMFNEVFLDDVFVPDELVVGEVNRGWEVARNTLSNERIAIGGGGGGNTGGGVRELLAAFRARAGEADAVALAEVGAFVCEGQSIELLGLRSTLRALEGGDRGAEASVRKLLGVEHRQRVADYVWASGGAGAVLQEPNTPGGLAAWAMLFNRATTIYGGTTEVQLNIIAERLLGLPRDPEPGS